jgi:hypothetical protein
MKETTDLAMSGAALANGIGAAVGDDGKIDLTDFGHFMDFMGTIPAAATGAQNIPGEIAAMTSEQRDKLVEDVKDRFDIPQDRVEAFVERCLDWALSTAKLVEEGKAVFSG